jgi:PAS domain S-box-containing protein
MRVFTAEEGDYDLQPLREWADFTLYRGSERGSQAPILAVAITAERPSPRSLKRLEHECSLASELDPAWAAQPRGLTRHKGHAVLILNDPGGEPLDRIMERHRGQPLDLTRWLTTAIGLAAALSQVHRQGLVHKELKPANALVDDGGRVWLTGFGIASRLPRERQASVPPDFIAGTLEYMSPEQTGRMNRSMDTRSDLYSLGVTLYQMLTGGLPFTATDPLEWVHCHIARRPVAPANRREVSEPLSAITMRLLAKNAEDRYQTAAGLLADLRRCLAQWQAQGRIETFPLGADDLSDRLLIPEKLYGREREVDTLLAAFDRVVAGGRPELVLVSGYSGVGKSAVVNELHKSLVPPRGLFASGKFDQYKRDIPYATLAQAFQGLIRPLLSKPEAELSTWRDALVRALNPNGSLLVDLVPELKFIIGGQPTVAPLPPQEAKTRSHFAFRQFIGVFARPEHPFALFLDDLQWLDAATLDVLEDLLVQDDLAHLLLIGAYRDNEVDPVHPLMRRLAAIRDDGAAMQEIRLTPLGSGDLARLIADTLHCDSRRATSLAQLIHGKTAGNPFFVIQFIHALVEEGLVRFEPADASWRWDLDAIHAKGYTDNVVDLMVNKLNRLPATTQTALQQLACIGISADSAVLSAVLETSGQGTETVLWNALQLELIVRSEESYRFAHDRVQEATYSLMAQEARAEAHLRIGRLLHAHTPPEEREEAIFEIINQFNRGAELIVSEEERFQVAALNLIAGKRAKGSSAYASALQHFVAGLALLTDVVWERDHDLIFQLELQRAECEFLTGELTAAAERLEILRSRATDTVELAMATCLGIDVDMTLGQMDRAIAIGLNYLRHVAIDWPLHPTEEQVKTEYHRIWSQLADREIEDVIDFPLMSDPASIATLDVLTKMVPPALFTDRNLFALVACRGSSLSIERGNNDGSCLIYVWFSDIAGHRFGDYQDAFRFAQLGYELVEKRGLKRFQASTYVSFAGLIMPWMKPLADCRKVQERAFEIANKIGDLTYAVYARVGLITQLTAAGASLLAVQSEAENGLDFARKAKFGFGIDTINRVLGFIRTLRGLTTQFGSFDHAEFDEKDFERNLNHHPPMSQFWHWVRKLQVHFLHGDFASAMEASLKARPLLWASPTFEIADYELYSALSRAALWDSAPSDQRREHFEALAAHYQRLTRWAESCPENFQDRATLAGAEIARIEGRSLDAMEMYEQAIRSARGNGFVHDEALAHEIAAQFYAARGFDTSADAHLRNARDCYDRWGAQGKVRQLDERYPRLLEGRTPATSSTIGAPFGQLDVETVVRALQALSSEMVLPRLIERLLRITVEHAGAERGLLILIRDGEPRLEAEATTGAGRIDVAVREGQATPFDLPQSALHYVIRTQETVLLDDASSDNVYSKDEYVRQNRARSVLCLPIVRQEKLVGVLYLENNLAPLVFTSSRVAVLQLLASQAAIALENASLYSDLKLQAGLLQSLPVSAWTLKSDGRPDFVNQVWLDYSGQTLDFVRSHAEAWMTAVHPEDREAVSRSFWNGVRSEQGFSIESRNLRAQDGSYRWQLQQAVVLRDAEGKVLKFVGTTTDIDAQKRAEEKLRESEHDARQTLDSVPGLALLSPTGYVETVSRQALEFFGRSVEELRGWGTNDTIHPEDLSGVIDVFTRAFSTGRPYEFTARFRRADGVYRWSQNRGFPLRDRNGDIARWCSQITDIDDQKRAEEALRESAHESNLIVDSIPGLIAALNVNGELERVNQPCLDYVGRSQEELSQWAVDGTIHPDDSPGYLQALERSFATGAPLQFEIRIRRIDGMYRWFNVSWLAYRDRQGHIVRWYVLLTDVDDRKRAEEALRQAHGDLARINRVTTMGELAASLAHELSQPISGAMTNANTCLRKLGHDEPNLDEVRTAVTRIARDAQRASDVIGRIRSQFEKAALNREGLDLNEIIRETTALLRAEAARYHISVRTELAADLPQIVGDRVQLQQVAMNLIVNSIEAMRDVDGIREMLIKSQRAENDRILVSVSDTGAGFPPQMAEQIFDPFFTTKPHGTGMGLRISRSIIESHGGRLRAVGTPESGATFEFNLPAAIARHPDRI